MKLVLSILFALMLSAACGEQVKIHEVETVVSEILVKADGYIHYRSNISEPNGLSSLNKRASSYWYQNIAHQGISAFGPSGYVVYRNVMDYGATGNFNFLAFATYYIDSIRLV
jgi:glucan 1,3-beta-glucosidase